TAPPTGRQEASGEPLSGKPTPALPLVTGEFLAIHGEPAVAALKTNLHRPSTLAWWTAGSGHKSLRSAVGHVRPDGQSPGGFDNRSHLRQPGTDRVTAASRRERPVKQSDRRANGDEHSATPYCYTDLHTARPPTAHGEREGYIGRPPRSVSS